MDYLSCSECGKRMAYDGEGNIREQLAIYETDVVCTKCVKRLKKTIEKLKKHDRRKR
jgi:hypothetical protein